MDTHHQREAIEDPTTDFRNEGVDKGQLQEDHLHEFAEFMMLEAVISVIGKTA